MDILHKGSQVYVEGANRTKTRGKDGATHYRAQIHTKTWKVLGAKPASTQPVPEEAVELPENGEADIRFGEDGTLNLNSGTLTGVGVADIEALTVTGKLSFRQE